MRDIPLNWLEHELQLELDGFLGSVARRLGNLSLHIDPWRVLDARCFSRSVGHCADIRHSSGGAAHESYQMGRAPLCSLCRAVSQHPALGADLSLVFRDARD